MTTVPIVGKALLNLPIPRRIQGRIQDWSGAAPLRQGLVFSIEKLRMKGTQYVSCKMWEVAVPDPCFVRFGASFESAPRSWRDSAGHCFGVADPRLFV